MNNQKFIIYNIHLFKRYKFPRIHYLKQNCQILTSSVYTQSLSRVQLFVTHGLQPVRLLYPWNSPGKNSRVGCHFPLMGNLLTQGWKLHLLYLLHPGGFFTPASPGNPIYTCITHQELRQSFTLNNPVSPYLPTIITIILCVSDHIVVEFYMFFPIAFGIEYPNLFSDFKVLIAYFPKKFIVWETFIQTAFFMNYHQLLKKFGEGNGNPLQYSCLENPIDRRAWWSTQSIGSQGVGQDSD